VLYPLSYEGTKKPRSLSGRRTQRQQYQENIERRSRHPRLYPFGFRRQRPFMVAALPSSPTRIAALGLKSSLRLPVLAYKRGKPMGSGDPADKKEQLFHRLLGLCKAIVVSDVSHHELLDLVVSEVHEHLGAELTGVLVPDSPDSPRRLFPEVWRGPLPESIIRDGIPYEGTASALVLATGRPRLVRIDAEGISEEIREIAQMLGVAEWMVVPFSPHGTLLAFSSRTGVFDEADLEELTAFGAFASCALQVRETTKASERESLAQRMHDGALQFMYAAQLRLQSALAAQDPDKLRAETAKAAELIADGIRDLRSVISSVHERPSTLADLLERLAGKLSNDVKVDLTVGSIPESLSEKVASEIYRIAIEATSNALRHGGSTRVRLAVDSDDDYLTLTVTDEGTGFDLDEAKWGMGLRSMKARAERIGAELAIESSPGGGTRVTLKLPSSRLK
jgi:signal transduction histidine kinase